jgi:protocatechuate 4,5-dioxygenase alpha chain
MHELMQRARTLVRVRAVVKKRSLKRPSDAQPQHGAHRSGRLRAAQISSFPNGRSAGRSLDFRKVELEGAIVATQDIPGTYIFDGGLALKGYPLNKMCYSFNEATNRAAFLDDEEAYCTRYGLSDEQRDAIRRRDVLALLEAGGNVYYLAKFAGIFGLGVQDIGAQQTGTTLEEFRAKLRAAAS